MTSGNSAIRRSTATREAQAADASKEPQRNFRHIVYVALAAFLLAGVLYPVLGWYPEQGELAQTASVSLFPASSSIAVGEEVTLQVRIQNIVDLYAIDVQTAFPAGLLEVQDENPMPNGWLYWGDIPVPDQFVRNTADNVAGTTWYAVTQQNPREPMSGSGVVHYITFKGLAPGTANIVITYCKAADRDGHTLATQVYGGTIEVRGPDTITPTESPVPTLTETETLVPTLTRTETLIPTLTATETPIPTLTRTETPIPTLTATETPVPTITRTETSVPTLTETHTPDPTLTRTATEVPTITPTVTRTPTGTSSPAPSVTPTRTQTPTITLTPVQSYTPTVSPSPSATATATLSPTASPTVTETVTPSLTPSPTVTLTPTVTQTPLGPVRFFWGFVWSGDPGSPAEPIPDVEVALFGADDADVEYGTLLARGLSQATGFYSVATTDEYAYYNLVETQPEGRLSIAAVAPSIATIRSLDWVQYADPGEGTFGPNAFWEESLGGPERHELIIPLVFN